MKLSSASSPSVRLRATSSAPACASSQRRRTSSRERPRASAAARAFCSSASPPPSSATRRATSSGVPVRSESTNAGIVLSQYARWPTISLSVQPAGSFSSHRGAGRAPIASRIERCDCEIFLSNSSLEVPRIVVFTEHLLQDKYLLADACVCSGALEEPRHQLAAVLGGMTQCVNRFIPSAPVALLSRLGETLGLLALDVRVDREGRDR